MKFIKFCMQLYNQDNIKTISTKKTTADFLTFLPLNKIAIGVLSYAPIFFYSVSVWYEKNTWRFWDIKISWFWENHFKNPFKQKKSHFNSFYIYSEIFNIYYLAIYKALCENIKQHF